MSVFARLLPSAPPEPALALARGDLFFTRRVSLVPDEPAGPQLALAIEALAPFPPEQLYHGHVPGRDGTSALVFAAFRRRFSADQTATWDSARLVTPEFIPLLAAREGDRAAAVLWTHDGRACALVWRTGEDLPCTILGRETAPEGAEAVLAAALARAGLPTDTAVRRLEGEPALANGEADSLLALVDGKRLGSLPASWTEAADVRDPDFLTERRRAARRDVWLWRGVVGSAALLALALALEIGAAALGFAARRADARVLAQADDVRAIETAQALANRIGELNERRLMPFEMLNLINPGRPETVVFQRALTRGLLKLEIEAQTGNADDVSAYTKALKTTPDIASAGARDIRTRDGQTTFMLDVEFKADALRHEAQNDEAPAPSLEPAAAPAAGVAPQETAS